MNTILDCYKNASIAFERWNLAASTEKQQHLQKLHAQLPAVFKPVFQYQLSYAEQEVAEVQQLVSPTGETNELYTQGRGVSVMLVESNQQSSITGFVAILAALLTAGNSVIICSDNVELNSLIEALITKQTLPENLLQQLATASYPELLAQDIRNFVYIGSENRTAELSQALAARNNAITSLVAETDLDTLKQSQDPKLVLRFITEKVRSTNVTAIGGNAQLLELGSAG
jgi:delta 1-pyrroline-5-carboxylate dehydrogenase